MKAVYFFHPVQKRCPVKKFFNEFTGEKGVRVLIDIRAKILRLLECNGLTSFSKPLRAYGFWEIKQRKTSSILIRILYFRSGNLMVLLHAFEKPDKKKYNSKDMREVEREYKIAEQNRLIFNKNKLYEDFE